MSDEKPPEKPTVKMETVPDWAVKLSMDVKTGFATVDAKIDEVKADVALWAGETKGLSERMLREERRTDEMFEWRARSSERAKTEEETRSKVDLEHQAQLVHIEERFKAITENQTAALLEKMAKTPQGQKLMNTLYMVVMLALSAVAAWLVGHGGK